MLKLYFKITQFQFLIVNFKLTYYYFIFIILILFSFQIKSEVKTSINTNITTNKIIKNKNDSIKVNNIGFSTIAEYEKIKKNENKRAINYQQIIDDKIMSDLTSFYNLFVQLGYNTAYNEFRNENNIITDVTLNDIFNFYDVVQYGSIYPPQVFMINHQKNLVNNDSLIVTDGRYILTEAKARITPILATNFLTLPLKILKLKNKNEIKKTYTGLGELKILFVKRKNISIRGKFTLFVKDKNKNKIINIDMIRLKNTIKGDYSKYFFKGKKLFYDDIENIINQYNSYLLYYDLVKSGLIQPFKVKIKYGNLDDENSRNMAINPREIKIISKAYFKR